MRSGDNKLKAFDTTVAANYGYYDVFARPVVTSVEEREVV